MEYTWNQSTNHKIMFHLDIRVLGLLVDRDLGILLTTLGENNCDRTILKILKSTICHQTRQHIILHTWPSPELMRTSTA